jgi:hypothetical protein
MRIQCGADPTATSASTSSRPIGAIIGIEPPSPGSYGTVFYTL